MIERLQRIATFLQPIRALILLIAAVAFVLAGASLTNTGWSQGDAITIPALLAFSWALTCYSFTGLFATPAPRPEPGANRRRRLSLRIRRGALWCLGVVMLAVGLALLVLTWQLLRTWFVS